MLYQSEAVTGWMLSQSPGNGGGDTGLGKGQRTQAGELGSTLAYFSLTRDLIQSLMPRFSLCKVKVEGSALFQYSLLVLSF